jgi:hypothetical protein
MTRQKGFSLIFVVSLIAIIIAGYYAYRYATTVSIQPIPVYQPGQEQILAITKEQLRNGWYWGTKAQKKPGTPNNWVYQEAGKASCWHQEATDCL